MSSEDSESKPMRAPMELGPAWRAACAEGFDMSLIELSLSKTPWERLLEHDDALQFAARLREAGALLHGKA